MEFFKLYGMERLITQGRDQELHGNFNRVTGYDCNGILGAEKNILRKITKREQFCFLLCYLRPIKTLQLLFKDKIVA